MNSQGAAYAHLVDSVAEAAAAVAPPLRRSKGSEDAYVTFTLGFFASLNPFLSIAHQSNAPDPR
jgi:hypothetical protein